MPTLAVTARCERLLRPLAETKTYRTDSLYAASHYFALHYSASRYRAHHDAAYHYFASYCKRRA